MTRAMEHPDLGDGGAVGTPVDRAPVRTPGGRVRRCLPALRRGVADGEPRGDESVRVDRRHDRVLVALEDDQGQPARAAGRAARSHRGERRPDVVRGPVGDPRVHPDRGVQVGVGRGHHRGHRAPGGEPGDEHARGVDAEVLHHAAGDARDDRRLTGARVLVGRGEPVPVAALVGLPRLLGIDDDEAVLLRQLVHPRSRREVGRVLLPAVEHDDERSRVRDVTRDVEPVAAAPGGLGVGERPVGTFGCQMRRAERHGAHRPAPRALLEERRRLGQAPCARELQSLSHPGVLVHADSFPWLAAAPQRRAKPLAR